MASSRLYETLKLFFVCYSILSLDSVESELSDIVGYSPGKSLQSAHVAPLSLKDSSQLLWTDARVFFSIGF